MSQRARADDHPRVAPQMGTATRRDGDGAGPAQACSAAASQPGTSRPNGSVSSRRIDARASGTDSITPPTARPASRSRSTSSFRFSSRLAMTRSGARAIIAARSGFCILTGVTARSAGWVHQSVAPTSRPGADRATASVSEGKRTYYPPGRAFELDRRSEVVAPHRHQTILLYSALMSLTDAGGAECHVSHVDPAPDGRSHGTLHVPDGDGPWPGVLVFPDAGGARETFGQMGDRLACVGYVVLVLDIYYRSGEWAPFDVATPFTDPAERAACSAWSGPSPTTRSSPTPEPTRTSCWRCWR